MTEYVNFDRDKTEQQKKHDKVNNCERQNETGQKYWKLGKPQG